MLRLLFIVILFTISSISFSSICVPEVNKSKPKEIQGGRFNDCEILDSKNYCNPTEGEDNYMTHHHIFDKQAWIEVLDKGLNHGGIQSEAAKENVIANYP